MGKIDVNKLSAAQNSNTIQDALEALPNFAIPEVEVDVDISTKASPKISIEFTDAHNTGRQALLQFKPKAKCAHGSQPKFDTVNTDTEKGDISCTVARVDWILACTRSPPLVPTVASVTKVLADATALTVTLVSLVTMSILTSNLDAPVLFP